MSAIEIIFIVACGVTLAINCYLIKVEVDKVLKEKHELRLKVHAEEIRAREQFVSKESH